MTIAQRFIAGEKRDNTTVPSGRLNPTPKHTVHRNRFLEIEADVKISHFQPPFIRPHGTSFFIHITGDKSPVYYRISLLGFFLKLPLFLS